jgi:hypothetical protein
VEKRWRWLSIVHLPFHFCAAALVARKEATEGGEGAGGSATQRWDVGGEEGGREEVKLMEQIVSLIAL